MKNSSNIIIDEIHKLVEGKTIKDIINLETDNVYNKSAASLIIKKYIDNKCIYNLDIQKDYKILLKFISVSPNYKCYEAMSFSNLSLYDILFEEWNSKDPFELAKFRKQLDLNFLFIPIIKVKVNGIFNNYLDWEIGEFSYWEPSERELEEIGREWSDVKERLQKGVELKRVKHGCSYRTLNNLPKQSETRFIHLRPHGKNSHDYDQGYLKYTNGAVEITKQSFWLNKKYINSLLESCKWKMNLKEE